MYKKVPLAIAYLTIFSAAVVFAQENQTENSEGDPVYDQLPILVVSGQETANVVPVATYATAISNLQFNPRVDLQSRNIAEAQGDVSIRGGIFENTGFRIGGATLIDPQTGHYSSELPIAPEMLTAPDVLVAGDNALYGFNSSVGTLSYGWSQIKAGGSTTLGGGNHGLNFQRIHSGWTGDCANDSAWSWGAEIESSRSESDGSVQFGDHDFDRSSARVQLLGPNSQTDFFAGYQSKQFGWAGMYTGKSSLHETEALKTRTFLINHHQNYASNSYWELSSSHRRHTDYYVMKREDPSVYDATHETEVTSLAFSGLHEISDAFAINHAAQLTADEIDSTELTNVFQSRSYVKLSILPEYRIALNQGESLTLRAGASLDDTNRDSSAVSPISDLTWVREHTNGQLEKVYLSYAQATQVVGYGAIAGGTSSGLFRSKPNLERELSQNLEFGGRIERASWTVSGAVFYRWDADLVDWTYSDGSPRARTASAVDIDTVGVELIGSKKWSTVEAIVSYSFLDKSEDYGNVDVDASFYALNYAKHRITLGTIWTPNDQFQVRVDNEWRSHEANALRVGPNEAFFTHLAMSYFPSQLEALELFVAVDNAWDDGFQEIPGTPGLGDQFSAGATFRW